MPSINEAQLLKYAKKFSNAATNKIPEVEYKLEELYKLKSRGIKTVFNNEGHLCDLESLIRNAEIENKSAKNVINLVGGKKNPLPAGSKPAGLPDLNKLYQMRQKGANVVFDQGGVPYSVDSLIRDAEMQMQITKKIG